jgi:hypothetical protein
MKICIIKKSIPRYINSLHTSILLQFRNHFSSAFTSPLFLNITIFVFNKLIYKPYSFEQIFTELIIFCRSSDDVEKVHISYLKRILKVRKSAVNYMVYCELGRFPMYIERYWFKLLYTDNCILKYLYEDMFESSVVKPNDKLNWAYIWLINIIKRMINIKL